MQAKEAAEFDTTIFPNSKTGKSTYYGKEGYEIHGMPEGSILSVDFELDSFKFIALKGGPVFQFNSSITFFGVCETVKEMDDLWKKLIENGQELIPLDNEMVEKAVQSGGKIYSEPQDHGWMYQKSFADPDGHK